VQKKSLFPAEQGQFSIKISAHGVSLSQPLEMKTYNDSIKFRLENKTLRCYHCFFFKVQRGRLCLSVESGWSAGEENAEG